MLILFLVGICALGYGDYNQQLKASPEVWSRVAQGTAPAPDQYRVGVVMAAYWVSRNVPVSLSKVFGAFDLVTSIIATLLLYGLTVRTQMFRQASVALQWYGSAAFLALTMYLMVWTRWYGKVSTLPTTCGVALMLWLWTPESNDDQASFRTTKSRRAGMVAGFFLVTVGLSFVRADVAMLACAGIFLASTTRVSPQLALPRRSAMTVSLVGGIAAGMVQLWLMRCMYPQANYGTVHLWMIAYDWWKLQKWVFALLFMTPFLWTLLQAVRRRYAGEGAGGAFLIAGVGHACLWLTFGRIDEVRIFLPMALATVPVTVEFAMLELERQIDR
jgi:hypothetical protein